MKTKKVLWLETNKEYGTAAFRMLPADMKKADVHDYIAQEMFGVKNYKDLLCKQGKLDEIAQNFKFETFEELEKRDDSKDLFRFPEYMLEIIDKHMDDLSGKVKSEAHRAHELVEDVVHKEKDSLHYTKVTKFTKAVSDVLLACVVEDRIKLADYGFKLYEDEKAGRLYLSAQDESVWGVLYGAPFYTAIMPLCDCVKTEAAKTVTSKPEAALKSWISSGLSR